MGGLLRHPEKSKQMQTGESKESRSYYFAYIHWGAMALNDFSKSTKEVYSSEEKREPSPLGSLTPVFWSPNAALLSLPPLLCKWRRKSERYVLDQDLNSFRMPDVQEGAKLFPITFSGTRLADWWTQLHLSTTSKEVWQTASSLKPLWYLLRRLLVSDLQIFVFQTYLWKFFSSNLMLRAK